MLPRIHGRCPGALRPMMSGDGLVLRLRPRLARFTRDQVLGICDAAQRHGAGVIDITSRANLQLRGIADADWPVLLARFGDGGLLDESADIESRRNVLVTPDWMPGDDSARIATDLLERLVDLPPLPAKVGFAIDAGPAPNLLRDSADFRIERGAHGGLILRADGRPHGVPVDAGQAVEGLIALARWFVDSGGSVAGRMARHRAPLPEWARGDALPGAPGPALRTGAHPLGFVCGLPFGQVEAARLARAVLACGATALRITPWRRVLFEGVGDKVPSLLDPDVPDFDAVAAAGWRVEACAGAPFCPQASVDTRALAFRLMRLAQRGMLQAPSSAGQRVVHVSGCAKACAYPQPATINVMGYAGAFDLSWQTASPLHVGLSADAIVSHLECC